MRCRARFLPIPIALLTGSSLSSLAAAGAPPQLYNKTITLSWHTVGTGTSDKGRTVDFDNTNTRTIYVSTAGRLFARALVYQSRNPAIARSGDLGPDDKKTNAHGQSVDLRFEGAQLIGVIQFASGARRIVATFDPSFSSCSLSVINGKSGGAALRVMGPSGRMYDIESMATVSPTCSIRDGNAFADQ